MTNQQQNLKTTYQNGEILNAIDINSITSAINSLFDRLNKEPTLSFDNEQSVFYFQSGRILLPLVFETGVAGAARYNVVCKQGETILNSSLISSNAGRTTLDVGAVDNRTGTYRYIVTATDALNNPSKNSLEFTINLGGIVFNTDILTHEEGLKRAPVQSTAVKTFKTNVTYAFPGQLFDGGMSNPIVDIFLDDNLHTPIASQTLTEANSELIFDLVLEQSGLHTLTFKVTQPIEGQNIPPSQISTYQFIVLESSNRAEFYIANSSFIDDKADVSSDIMQHFIDFAVVTDSAESFNVMLSIDELELLTDAVKTPGIISHIFTTPLSNLQIQRYNFNKLYGGRYQLTLTFQNPPDGIAANNYTKIFKISQGANESYIVKRGDKQILTAFFEANNQNSGTNVWSATTLNTEIASNLQFDLYGLNHVNNGWQEIETADGTKTKVLKFSGNSYGKLTTPTGNFDFSQFLENSEEGIALEVYFKGTYTGNFKSKILSNTPPGIEYGDISAFEDRAQESQGFDISYGMARCKVGVSEQHAALLENQYNHIVIVIDKTKRDKIIKGQEEDYNSIPSLKIYVNGVLTRVTSYSEGGIDFLACPLYLNSFPSNEDSSAAPKENGFGTCEIKTIRLYNSYLTGSDIYQNFLSCQLSESDRNDLIERNTNSAHLPKFFFILNKEQIYNDPAGAEDGYYKANFVEMDQSEWLTTNKKKAKKMRVNCTVYSVSTKDGQQILNQLDNADIYFQGTSTLEYPVKNYLIKNYSLAAAAEEDRRCPFKPAPLSDSDSWISDYTYTLKCDYMDQSHKNNTPTAKYYDQIRNNIIGEDNTKLSPPLQTNQQYRDTIDGFACVVYTSDNVGLNELANNLTTADAQTAFINTLMEECDFRGTYMFNIDKAGSGLGFNFVDNAGNQQLCISYEGQSNINYSAATFYPLTYANKRIEEINKQEADESKHHELYKDLNAYYTATMEPRYVSDSMTEATIAVTENEQEYTISKFYYPLHRATKWLEQFAPLCNENDTEVTTTDRTALCNTFRSQFKQYFSYEYCLTYYLQALVFTQIDNIGKNAMFDCWVTQSQFDNDLETDCPILYPRPYDMDSQMGLTNFGEETVLPSAEISPLLSPIAITGDELEHPRFAGYGLNTYQVTTSRLWIPFAIAYAPEIAAKYKELRRSGFYSLEKIVEFVNDNTSAKISETFYNRDASAKYLSVLETGGNSYKSKYIKMLQGNRNNKYQLFLKSRLIFLDSYFDYTHSVVNFTANGNSTFKISVSEPVYALLSLDGGNDIHRKFLEPEKNSTQTITANLDGQKNSALSPADQLLAVTWPAKTSSLTLSNATNLTEITLSDENIGGVFTDLDVSFMPYLTKIDLETFPKLNALKLGDLPNLTTFRLKNLPAFTGNISLNATNVSTVTIDSCNLTELTLTNNTNLTTIDLTKCSKLQKLTVIGSPNLKTLDISKGGLSALSKIIIKDCPNLQALDLSPGVGEITELVLDNLPQLSIFNGKSVQFNLNEINLSALENLNNLNLAEAQCAQNTTIVLNDNVTLTTLYLNDTNIAALCTQSQLDSNEQCIDLSQLSFTADAKVQLNKNVQVTNIKLNENIIFSESNAFKDCTNLIKVSGSLHLESATCLFENCKNLSDLDDLVVTVDSESLGASFAFNNCQNLEGSSNLEQYVLQPILEKAQYAQSMFQDCYKFNFIQDSALKMGEHTTNIQSMFLRAYALTYVPSGFFTQCQTQLVNASQVFYQCTNLTNLNSMFDTNISINGITSINEFFSGCSKLKLRDALLSLPSLPYCTKANATFYRVGTNTELTTLDKVTYTELNTFFSRCNKLQTINVIFAGTSGIESCSMIDETGTSKKSCFENATQIVEAAGAFAKLNNELHLIPDYPFFGSGNRVITWAGGLFADTKLKKLNNNSVMQVITSDFLNSSITRIGYINYQMPSGSYFNAAGIFSGNTSYTTDNNGLIFSIDIFKNLKLTDCSGAFANETSSNIKEIQFCVTDGTGIQYTTAITDSNFFGNETGQLTTMAGVFKRTNLTEIDANILPKNVKNLASAFAYCTSLKTIENFNSLFAQKTSLTNISSIFNNCQQLTCANINTQDLFMGCSQLQNISYMFYNCYQLGEGMCSGRYPNISNEMFKDCTLLSNANFAFANCYLLDGYLGQEGDDEQGLFACCTQLTEARGLFQNCFNLKSRIPPKMFYTEAQSGYQIYDLQGAFCCCYSLSVVFQGAKDKKYSYTTIAEDGDIDEIVPEQWIQFCPNLRHIDYLFSSYGSYPEKFYSWHVGDVTIDGIKLSDYLNQRQSDNTIYAPEREQLTLTNSQKLFQSRNQLRSMNFLFHNAANGTGATGQWKFDGRTFDTTNLRTVKGAFAYTSCYSTSSNTNGTIFTKEISGQIQKTYINNAEGLFAGSKIDQKDSLPLSRAIFTSGATLTGIYYSKDEDSLWYDSDTLTRAGYGIGIATNRPDFIEAVNYTPYTTSLRPTYQS